MLLDRVRRQNDRLLILPPTRITADQVERITDDQIRSDLVDQLAETFDLGDGVLGRPGEEDLAGGSEGFPSSKEACSGKEVRETRIDQLGFLSG